jgi:hypothetical protein
MVRYDYEADRSAALGETFIDAIERYEGRALR